MFGALLSGALRRGIRFGSVLKQRIHRVYCWTYLALSMTRVKCVDLTTRSRHVNTASVRENISRREALVRWSPGHAYELVA